jgi:hypothetical protein
MTVVATLDAQVFVDTLSGRYVGRGKTSDHACGTRSGFGRSRGGVRRNAFTRYADRRDFGEERLITAGFLRERFVVVVWMPRDGGRADYSDEART